MKMQNQTEDVPIQMNELTKILSSSGSRIKRLKEWLMNEVWSNENFDSFEPVKYLEQGEKVVSMAEELMIRSACGIYDEITEEAISTKPLISMLDGVTKTAVVLLDGTSIRELPLLEKLAVDTGYEIVRTDYSYAALPSETQSFVEQRVLIGKKLGPSQLVSRRDLSDLNIRYHYYDAPTRTFVLNSEKNLLLWSSFPDVTYKDSGSRSSQHFEEMKRLFESVWKNIILSIPNDYRIIITSDHGYVFFGQGLETSSLFNVENILDNNRFKYFGEEDKLPDESINELQIIPRFRLAMLRGRIKNRVQGPSGNKAYRHGGMSVMEMFTPMLEIRKK